LLELQLTVRPVPNATFNGPADHCLDNGPITLDQGQPPGGFYWGDAVRGNLFEPAIKRDYEIRYTVTNESGCSDTAVLRIRVHDECNAFLYLPDAFIPDDPTRPENRRFSMVSYNITKVEIKIFDRYGQVVFESRDPNFGWDGTKGGGQAPSGTYIYLLNYEDAAGKTGLRSGLLHLVR
jgi:gliding motility-associated-like protein